MDKICIRGKKKINSKCEGFFTVKRNNLRPRLVVCPIQLSENITTFLLNTEDSESCQEAPNH